MTETYRLHNTNIEVEVQEKWEWRFIATSMNYWRKGRNPMTILADVSSPIQKVWPIALYCYESRATDYNAPDGVRLEYFLPLIDKEDESVIRNLRCLAIDRAYAGGEEFDNAVDIQLLFPREAKKLLDLLSIYTQLTREAMQSEDDDNCSSPETAEGKIFDQLGDLEVAIEQYGIPRAIRSYSEEQ